MFKIYDEPLSPNDGACLTCVMSRCWQMRGACLRQDEPESPNDGACLAASMLYEERLSPNEGACFRYVVNCYRQMRGRV